MKVYIEAEIEAPSVEEAYNVSFFLGGHRLSGEVISVQAPSPPTPPEEEQ